MNQDIPTNEGPNTFLIEQVQLMNRLLATGISKEKLNRLYDLLYDDIPEERRVRENHN